MAFSTDQSVYTPAPRENRKLDHLPGSYGLPLFGRTFKALRDPLGNIRTQYETYGPISRTNVFFQKSVNLFGPEANEFVLRDRERNFSSRYGWDRALGLLFPRGLMLRDFDDHRFHRRIMQEAFRKEALADYVNMMNPEIESGIAHWADNNPLLFYPAIKKLTLDMAARVFMGLKLGPEADQLNRAFMDAVQASVGVVRVPIPGTQMWRGVRGRELLCRFFASMIEQKRASEDGDFFARICRAETEDGAKFSDDEIIDHMNFLMMAAHDTTTSASTTLIYHLAKYPEWQERLREEARALDKTHAEHGDMDHFQQTGQAFREAMRLFPPVVVIPRRTVRACEFGGHTIPANTNVAVFPAFVHRMPEWWDEPEKFDPERFSPERAEDKQHPFLYVPFGGGPHTCIGMHFAELQVKAIMHQFLLRYRVSVARDYYMPVQALPIPKPSDGLPLKIERL